MNIDGQCNCGAITFTGEADPARVVICHCTDCQAMSGAPYRANVPVPVLSFVLRGEPKRSVKTGSSRAQIVTTICGTCGSPIFSQKGDARQGADLSSKRQGFCDSAMPYAQDIGMIPKATKLPRQT